MQVLFFIHPMEGILVRKKMTSHEEWADKARYYSYLQWSRGVYWSVPNRLFFYYGADTRDYARIVPDIMANAQGLLGHLDGNEETTFCGGLTKDWEPVQVFGNLKEFLKGRNPKSGFLQ